MIKLLSNLIIRSSRLTTSDNTTNERWIDVIQIEHTSSAFSESGDSGAAVCRVDKNGNYYRMGLIRGGGRK
jgi:hypothetical protein